jgi:hypothetical protein
MLEKRYFETLDDKTCGVCLDVVNSHEKARFTSCCACLLCKKCYGKVETCPFCREVLQKPESVPKKKKNVRHGEITASVCGRPVKMKVEYHCG